MSNTTPNTCVPCRSVVHALPADVLARMAEQLGAGWRLVGGHHLEKDFRFSNFKSALDFVNRIGEVAESLGHHPDIHVSWGRALIQLWTHKVDGVTDSDFVLARRIDAVAE
jgi:4a-hydroxytetrahydrobiopterin dehydratase